MPRLWSLRVAQCLPCSTLQCCLCSKGWRTSGSMPAARLQLSLPSSACLQLSLCSVMLWLLNCSCLSSACLSAAVSLWLPLHSCLFVPMLCAGVATIVHAAWLQLLSDRRLAPFFEGVNMMRLVVKQVT